MNKKIRKIVSMLVVLMLVLQITPVIIFANDGQNDLSPFRDVRIGVVPGAHDNIGAVLRAMNIDHFVTLPVGNFTYDEIENFQVIFVNCAAQPSPTVNAE